MVSVATFPRRTRAIEGACYAVFVVIGVTGSIATVGGGLAGRGADVAEFTCIARTIKGAIEAVFCGRIAGAVAAACGGLLALGVVATLKATVRLFLAKESTAVHLVHMSVFAGDLHCGAITTTSADALSSTNKTGLVLGAVSAAVALLRALFGGEVTETTFLALVVRETSDRNR